MNVRLVRLCPVAMMGVALFLMATPIGCASYGGNGELEAVSARLRAITAQRTQQLEADRRQRNALLASFAAVGAAPVGGPRSLEAAGFKPSADWRNGHGDELETPAARWFGDTVTLSDLGDDQLNADARTATPNRQRRTPLPGFWETVQRDLREWPPVFWKDTKDVYTNRTNLLILGSTYGVALALQETGPDDTVEDSFRTHTTFKSDFREVFGVLGNPGTHFGLAGIWYLIGQQTQDEKTYDVGTKLFRALAVTGISTILGQAATWDDSPNGEWGGFPSGHTSSTFAFASVMHREYGPAVGVPLYALGVLVGWGRLEDQEHYLSDVVMGGVMGLIMGHTIAYDGEPIRFLGGEIIPYVDPPAGASGLAWVTHFK